MLERLRRGKFDRVLPSARRRLDLRRSRSLRPLLEGLEDRLVLATITWNSVVSPAGGNWNMPASWVGNIVPTAADDAVIDLTAAGTVTVSDTRLVNSLAAGAETTISLSGSLTLAANATLAGRLTQTGGTLAGAGTLTVSGLTTWTGGTMSGAGTINANDGLAIGAPNTDSQVTLSARTLNNNNAAATVAGFNANNHGLYLQPGATFNNNASASLSFLVNGFAAPNGGTPIGGTFNKAGTLAKTGGTGISNFAVAINNSGVVNVQVGTLNLQGAFSNFSAATNTLTEGTYIIAGTLQFPNANIMTNAATIVLDGAALRVIDGSGNNAFRSFTANASGGNFTIRGGRSLPTPGGVHQCREPDRRGGEHLHGDGRLDTGGRGRGAGTWSARVS